ncbi:MAG: two-component system response regulator [Candidatus Latescibacteria bacterium 4484_7]|nr:MAG: two-component system response regulator [Candidatus Latescibacteria bacterium 4484_7]
MKKILVIEDSRMISQLIKTQLESRGFECETVADGLEGLKTAKATKPDLIVLDVMLPSMNGFKICRLLKFDRRYRDIPIIMLTTRSDAKDVRLGKSTGADLYMTKPFETEELVANINRLLSKVEEEQTV